MNPLDMPQVNFHSELTGTSETRYFPLFQSPNRLGVQQTYYALGLADDLCCLKRK